MTTTTRTSLPVYTLLHGKLVRTSERLFFVRVEPERSKPYVVVEGKVLKLVEGEDEH